MSSAPHKNFHKSANYKYNGKLSMSGMGEDQELTMILRGDSPTKIREFTLVYRILIDGSWINIRKHCWMENHGGFHTHIRLGKGKHNWKITESRRPKVDCNVQEAIDWSQNDMWKNCYYYRRFFENKLK